MIKSIKLAMCILFSMTMLESAWANQSLVLSHNLILFAYQTKTGEKINLKSLRQAGRYILSFHAGKYAATFGRFNLFCLHAQFRSAQF